MLALKKLKRLSLPLSLLDTTEPPQGVDLQEHVLDIEVIGKLIGLECLKLCMRKLKSLAPIADMVNLRELDLSEVTVEDLSIPDSVYRVLEALETLYMVGTDGFELPGGVVEYADAPGDYDVFRRDH